MRQNERGEVVTAALLGVGLVLGFLVGFVFGLPQKKVSRYQVEVNHHGQTVAVESIPYVDPSNLDKP